MDGSAQCSTARFPSVARMSFRFRVGLVRARTSSAGVSHPATGRSSVRPKIDEASEA